MKTIILLFIPFLSFAQPNNTSTILVKDISFDQVASTLLDVGFSPAIVQKDLGYITTDWKPFCSDCAPEFMLTIRIKDSIAYIKGQWRTNAGISLHGPHTALNSATAYIYPISNAGPKLAKIAFNLMNIFAYSLKGELFYDK